MQVVINLTRSADDLLAEFSAGAKLYLYSAATEDGSYSAVGSGTAIVSGQQRYEVYDATGTPGTTWYKFRAGNSGGSAFSEYSDPWLSTSLTAYATLDDLRATLALGSSDTTHDAWLERTLEDVSSQLDGECGRSFYRYPQVTGTTTITFDVTERSESLRYAIDGRRSSTGVALDILSITTLEVRDSESSSYVEVSAGDSGYYLQPGMGPGVAGTDWPYEDIVLSPSGSYTCWPRGYRAVRITGAFGFPRVPNVIRHAVVAEVRERFRQSISGGAAPQGINEFGTPMFLTGHTNEWRTATRTPYARRSWIG